MSREVEVFTIGVEEEFQIIDPVSYALAPGAESIVQRTRETLGEAVQYELILSQIEIATPVCQTLDEVQMSLTNMRRTLVQAAEQADKRIAAAGTHPFSPWYEQEITPKERYQQLVNEYHRLIQEQIIFGCHVHIGLGSREMTLEVMNRARIWLSVLLALSANSPFWEGQDTAYASYRTGLWWTSPLSGPPPFFTSRHEHDAFINALVATRSVEDATRIYWDIRLPQRYKTIEFRIMDVCLTVDETIMMAGLIRALVRTCYEAALRQQPVPEVRAELLKVANWRAARFGLEGELMDVVGERSVPAAELIERFLLLLRPALEANGDWERVSRQLARTLQHGNGAMRQRAVFQRTQKIEDVVQYIIDETTRGCQDI